jgi:hypothetical protein
MVALYKTDNRRDTRFEFSATLCFPCALSECILKALATRNIYFFKLFALRETLAPNFFIPHGLHTKRQTFISLKKFMSRQSRQS